ncbi:MAG: peptidoglycan D,D-transpeptidase FtsI family protein [Caulobacterales bacterium]
MTIAEVFANPFSPIGRWLGRRMWWIEHGFERARASDKAVDDTRLRIFFVLALFGAGFITLSLGATKAALFSAYGHDAEPLAPSMAPRADLVDRNGQLLALDLNRYGLYVDPQEIIHKPDVRAALLAALPTITPVKLDKALMGDKREFVIGALTPDVKAQVHDLGLPGVSFEEEGGRAYPLGQLAAHLIGFSSKDGIGLAGAERAFDGPIRADAGKATFPLAIDLRVQGALENELDRAGDTFKAIGGVGLVVNVRTGEILGMASYPSYDPNLSAKADPKAMVNHAAATVYEPGSVMKVFTLAMGIDSGVATTETRFDARTPLVFGSQTIHDFEATDSVLTLSQVFTKSSNIGAARLGLLAGPDRMDHYFRSFGLFAKAPSELIESAWPIKPALLKPATVASMSFGHAISVSPLAIATGMSAVLNGGIYRPLTLSKLAPGQAPAPGRRVIQESTSRTMLDLMRLNVTNGTGAKANIPGLRVGGKTGTATKVINGRYDKTKNVSSFAAIFPTDGALGDDRYFVLIMLDQPQPTKETGGFTTGALTSAPAVGRVIERIAPFVGVKRVIIPSDLSAKPPDPSALGDEQ